MRIFGGDGILLWLIDREVKQVSESIDQSNAALQRHRHLLLPLYVEAERKTESQDIPRSTSLFCLVLDIVHVYGRLLCTASQARTAR